MSISRAGTNGLRHMARKITWKITRIKNYFFLVSGQKARISRPLRDRKRRVFSPLTKKNRIRPSIRPLSINKECPKSLPKSPFTILTPVKIRFHRFSFRPPSDLVYYRFFWSLNTKIGVIWQRNWGFTLTFAKTTPKKGFFFECSDLHHIGFLGRWSRMSTYFS